MTVDIHRVFTVSVCWVVVTILYLRERAVLARERRGRAASHWIELLPEGLRHSAHGAADLVKWEALSGIEETEENLSFVLKDGRELVVPRQAFGSEAERRGFAATARAYQGDAAE